MNKLLLFALAATINLNAWFVDGTKAVAIDLERECVIAVSYMDNLGQVISFYDRDQPSHNLGGPLMFRIDQFNYMLYGEQVGNTWVSTQLFDHETPLVVHAMKHGHTLSVWKDGIQIGNFPLEGSAAAFRVAFKNQR
jgi:hypothetical protein